MPLLEDGQVHGHLAQCEPSCDRLPGNPDVRAVECRRAEEVQGGAPATPSQREIAVVLVQPVEDGPVPAEELRSKVEGFDLFGKVVSGEERL